MGNIQYLMHSHFNKMNMFFTFSPNTTILFKKWRTTTYLNLVLSSFVILLLAVLKEFLSFFRREKICKKLEKKPRSKELILADCGLYFSQIILSFALMLITMTFNVFLFFAVTLGLTIGRTIFQVVFSSYGNIRGESDCCSAN